MLTTQQQTSSYLPFSDGLRFTGDCGYRIDNDRVVIRLNGIANDRPEDNLSGTLSAELWALDADYQGGAFSGHALAATQVGQISGQHWLADCEYDLLFNRPPAGNWTVCLMLREWNGSAYETRAWVNFAVPYQVTSPVSLVPSKKQEEPVAKSEVTVVKEETPVVVSIESKRRPVEKQDTPAVKKAGKEKTSLTAVSVNNASEKELLAVKGLSLKLARAIIADRPYKDLDELIKVKGMGSKMLEKVRSALML